MKHQQTLSESIHHFFFHPELPVTIAVFRILFGILALCNLAFLAPDLMVWYGETGLVSQDNARSFFYGPRFSLFHWLPKEDSWTWGLFVVWTVATFFQTLGFYTRTSGTIALICMVSFHHRNPFILHSGDTLMRTLTFLMIFSHAGKAFSVDRWLETRRSQKPVALKPDAPWAFRVIQLQISLVYFTTYLFKLQNTSWQHGNALYYILRLEDFKRFPLPDFCYQLGFIQVMTWGTLVLEMSLGVFIWFPQLRRPLIVLGILFHLGIEYTMNIPLFELLMVICLLNFIRPEEMIAMIDTLRRRSTRFFPSLRGRN